MSQETITPEVRDLNTTRHLRVFNPQTFGNKKVDIIGVGATGSKIGKSLAKLGIQNLHFHDGDVVESHNIPNQEYGHPQVSYTNPKSKVDALSEIIYRDTGIHTTPHNHYITKQQGLGPIVYLLTDSMESRKEIWKHCLKFNPSVELVIETRMGASEGRVYAINPLSTKHIQGWENTLYDDEIVDETVQEAPACDTQITVGPTADFISSLAVWTLIKYVSGNNEGKVGWDNPDLKNEIIMGVNPLYILSNSNFE